MYRVVGILFGFIVLCVAVVHSQDEFNKVLGVTIDKGCMESVLFMPNACEAGGKQPRFLLRLYVKISFRYIIYMYSRSYLATVNSLSLSLVYSQYLRTKP